MPARYRPSSGKWIGVAARSTVFVYNRSALRDEDVPKSLVDLAVAAMERAAGRRRRPARTSRRSSARCSRSKGEAATAQWLAGMKANAASYRGNGAVLRAVNAGQVPAGVIYHYYAFVDQAKTGENTRNVSLHYFRGKDPGAFVSVSGAGVLASSKQPANAQSFVRWVTSRERAGDPAHRIVVRVRGRRTAPRRIRSSCRSASSMLPRSIRRG